MIPKTGGDVKVLGEEPYKIGPQLRQRIGYVSEEQGLYGWMTVEGIIKFCKSLYLRWDDALVEKYLAKFKLEKRSRIRTLSHGQTVKLALLLSLAPKPELLIFDEPMTGLDPLAQHEFMEVIMREIGLEGRTIFFSTHILADVENIASHVAILNKGRIQAFGTIKEICGKIKKIRVKEDSPEALSKAVVLTEEKGEKVLLVPADSLGEIAAASEMNEKSVDARVNLQEAFFFYCSGEGN